MVSLPVIFPELIVPVVILVVEVNVACLPFKLVSIPDIFVPTLVLLDTYNKLVPAFIVGAVMVVPVLPVIEPESIVPVIILVVVEFNDDCFVFKLVSIPDIFVPTLLDPYNKLLDAVIVGALMVVFLFFL